MAKTTLSQILQRSDEDALPRGLGAMAKTAAAPVNIDELEQELGELVRESRPRIRTGGGGGGGPILPGPLSEEAKALKSQSVLMGKDKMVEGAKAAAAAYRADAEALEKAVNDWCIVLDQQAQEMVEHIARHHDSLKQAQKLFEQAMRDHRPIPVIDLPNPLPSSSPDDRNEVGEPTVRHYNSAAGD